jgi:hypothetical protein
MLKPAIVKKMITPRRSRRIRPAAAALVAAAGLYAQIPIDGVPFTCDREGATYVLTDDLQVTESDAVRITARDVTIDGRGHTIAITGNGDGLEAIDCNGGGSVIRNCRFLVSGSGRLTIIEHDRGGTLHGCTIDVVGLRHGSSGYPRLINANDHCSYYDNIVTVDSTSRYVNVFIGWDVDSSSVYDNTIHFASVHGRIIRMDAGTDGWKVHHNHIIVTSPNRGDSTTYVIMCRNGNAHMSNQQSAHHEIYNNLIDATDSRETIGLSISSDAFDVVVRNNIVLTPTLPVSINNRTDRVVISCNQLTNTSGGRVIRLWGDGHERLMIRRNEFHGGGTLIRAAHNLPGRGTVRLCDNEGLYRLDQISAESIDDFAFGSPECAVDGDDCGPIGLQRQPVKAVVPDGRRGAADPREHQGRGVVAQAAGHGTKALVYTPQGRLVARWLIPAEGFSREALSRYLRQSAIPGDTPLIVELRTKHGESLTAIPVRSLSPVR